MNQSKWIRKAKNGLNIIFIHGINSDENCWRNKNGSFWPYLLEDERELTDTGIYIFSYRTGINTGFYNLGDIVDSLREDFKSADLFSSAGVIFVCHSMGGIIARRFLVTQHSKLVERGVNKIGLFLVASPSLGSRYANMIALLSNVMGHTQANALQFSQSNVWLNDLDKDFINLINNKNLRIRGKELVEDLPLYGKRFIKRQIVEPFAAARYFEESLKVSGSDHSTIATPADNTAEQHRALVTFVKDFIKEEFDSLIEKDNSIQNRESTVVAALPNLEHSKFYGGISQNVTNSTLQGGMQAAQGDGNVQSQNFHPFASSEQGLTQEQVIQLFAQLESVLKQPELPGEVQAKAAKYLETAKEEVQAKEPDKQLAAGNLKRMAETIESTSKTMESSKKIWETTKPILEAVLPWLGVAKGFFGF